MPAVHNWPSCNATVLRWQWLYLHHIWLASSAESRLQSLILLCLSLQCVASPGHALPADQAAAQADVKANVRHGDVGKPAAAPVAETDRAEAAASTAPVRAAAAGPSPGSALGGKPSDSMSTLACLMKDMPPAQLQEVLQGLLQSGTSAVPLEVGPGQAWNS